VRSDYRGALEQFSAALRASSAARDEDVHLVAMLAHRVASLELMLRSVVIAGTHRERRQLVGLDVSTSPTLQGLAAGTLVADAWQFAHDGDAAAAFACARWADRLAPSDYARVRTLANRAAIARAFRNDDAAREHAEDAAERAQVLDWVEAGDDEIVALLALVEALVEVDPAAAYEFFGAYQRLTELRGISGDPARVSYVCGVLHRAIGDTATAGASLRAAYHAYTETEHLWRATLTLIALDETEPAPTSRVDTYLDVAAAIVRAHFPCSFLTRRLGRARRAYDDPTVATLTPAKRAVLRRLVEGHGPRRAAELCSLSEGTARNYIAEIEAAFGVHSIQELLVACYRRGLDTISWDEPAPVISGADGRMTVPLPSLRAG